MDQVERFFSQFDVHLWSHELLPFLLIYRNSHTASYWSLLCENKQHQWQTLVILRWSITVFTDAAVELSSAKLYFSNFKPEHCTVFILVCFSRLVSSVWWNKRAVFSCLERGFPWQIAKYASHLVILRFRKVNLGLAFRTFIVLLWFDLLSLYIYRGIKMFVQRVLKIKHFLFTINITFCGYLKWEILWPVWMCVAGMKTFESLNKQAIKIQEFPQNVLLNHPVFEVNPQIPPSALSLASNSPIQWKTLIHTEQPNKFQALNCVAEPS